ncbi:unnamed protein product, partial [Pylaiella littoralis]
MYAANSRSATSARSSAASTSPAGPETWVLRFALILSILDIFGAGSGGAPPPGAGFTPGAAPVPSLRRAPEALPVPSTSALADTVPENFPNSSRTALAAACFR